MTAAPAFDDDRLLAFALELDDDPGLVAAAAADEGLRRRLDAARADVDRVGAQVRAAVPAPDAVYADVGDPRWAGLQGFFAAPQPAKRRGGASRWLRVLAPVAVAVVALAVGLAIINEQNVDTVAVNGAVPEAAKAASDAAGSLTGVGPTAGDRSANAVQALRDELDQYALVVLAKARAASGAFQQFVVVRILKGDGPDRVRLRVADHPADVGRLHLLLLRPSSDVYAEPSPAPVPSVSAATAMLDGVSVGEPVTYAYQGETAVLRELPADTDPAAVRLP